MADGSLQRQTKAKVVDDAAIFCETHGLAEHTDLFRRAALVARDSTHFQNLTELHEDEMRALQRERNNKWHGPFQLWYSITLCAVGAATQGWDQTGSNGANLSFPTEFGIGSGTGRDLWIVGSVNAIIFLSAGAV